MLYPMDYIIDERFNVCYLCDIYKQKIIFKTVILSKCDILYKTLASVIDRCWGWKLVQIFVKWLITLTLIWHKTSDENFL